jgi:hypothetical protein
MAGAYRLAVSRYKVVSSTGDEWPSMTVTVRDGLAQVRNGRNVVAELEVADFEVIGRRSYQITGLDGTVWDVSRKGCGCGSK